MLYDLHGTKCGGVVVITVGRLQFVDSGFTPLRTVVQMINDSSDLTAGISIL